MTKDEFFTQDICDRCRKSLESGRIMSWFNDETICFECSKDEQDIKNVLKNRGEDPSKYEGCGYIPQI